MTHATGVPVTLAICLDLGDRKTHLCALDEQRTVAGSWWRRRMRSLAFPCLLKVSPTSGAGGCHLIRHASSEGANREGDPVGAGDLRDVERWIELDLEHLVVHDKPCERRVRREG